MVEINLLPAQYRRRSEPNIWLYAGIGVVAFTALAILIPEIVVGTQVGNLQSRLEDQRGQISALQTSVAPEFRRLTDRKAQLTAIGQTATSLSTGKTYWSNDLTRFTKQLPTSGVALTSLIMHDPANSAVLYNGKAASKEYELVGTAASSEALVTLLKAYDQQDYGVNFKNTQRNVQADTAENKNQPDNFTFAATVGQFASTPISAAATIDPATGAPISTPASGVPADPTPPADGSAPAAPAAPTDGVR